MLNLIKSDLFRYFKSKQVIVISIIAVVFSIAVPSLNYLLQVAVSKLENQAVVISELRMTGSALESMISSLNPSSLFGFLLPIFVSIVLAADFKDGTIRNKIVTGISKEKIHLSSFIATVIFISAIMLGYGLVSFIFSFVFYNVVPSNVDMSLYIGNLFLSLLFSVLSYIFIASVILLLVNLFRTQGLSAFMYILFLFAFQFVGGIFEGIISVIKAYETNMDGIINFLTTLNYINPFYLMTTIQLRNYSTGLLVANSTIFIAFTVANYFLAYLLFVKKDIK